MLTSLKYVVICITTVYICTTAAMTKLGKKEDRTKLSEAIPRPTKEDKKKLERGLEISTMETTSEDDFIEALMQQTQNKRSIYKPVGGGGETKQIRTRRAYVKRNHLPDRPRPYGLNSNLLGPDHPMRAMRIDDATNTTECHRIRSVPERLRKDEDFYVGIDPFYTKYTQAYGIPIIGSKHVSDHGLKRACYVVTMMLASRYDIRAAFYNFYGRIALIGDEEEQTSLPEYSTWDPLYWNTRARGLGPTLYLPLTSAGDDNQRCKAGGRYFDQDILVHELAHGIELLAAHFVIPGFKSRLESHYQQNVVLRGMWAGTYAAKNTREYFAVATQFYFNAFRGGSYRDLGVVDHDSLRAYDPQITQILDEIHPCSIRNPFIHRCQWKACDASYFKLFLDTSYIAMSTCEVIKVSRSKPTLDDCAFYTCYHQGNVFQWQGNVCEVLRCKNTKTVDDLGIVQGKSSFNIYTAKDIPKPDLHLEFGHQVRQGCVKHLAYSVRCAPILREDRKLFKGKANSIARSFCKQMHYCYDRDTKECFEPLQDCVDKSLECPDMESKGLCLSNPGFMYIHCPFSCDKCEFVKTLEPGLLADMCQDKNVYCSDWAKAGQCDVNPNYMTSHCQISCGKCLPDLDKVGL